VIIKVKVKPNSKKEGVERKDGYFIVRVNKPPIDGKANERVIELLAKYFKVSKSKVNIIKGHKGKEKIIEIVQP